MKLSELLEVVGLRKASFETPRMVVLLFIRKGLSLDDKKFKARCEQDAHTLCKILARNLPRGTFEKLAGIMSEICVKRKSA